MSFSSRMMSISSSSQAEEAEGNGTSSLSYQLQQNIEKNQYHISSLRKSIISDSKRRHKIPEIFIYLCFMMVFFLHLLAINRYRIDDASFINYSVRGGLFNHEKTIERSFSNTTMYFGLDTIHNERDVWSWLTGAFTATLWDETQMEPNSNQWINQSQAYYVNRNNRLLGSVRLIQWRAPKTRCDMKIGALWDPYCYGSYSFWSGGDSEPFGNNNQFTHKSCEGVGGPGITSFFGIRKGTQAGILYECSGYAEFLPYNLTPQETRNKIQYLMDSDWIDRQTRMIAVEYFTYNPNINFYTAVQFTFEMYPSGASVPNLMTQSFALDIPQVFWNRTLTAFTYIFVTYYILVMASNLIRKLIRTVMILLKKLPRDQDEPLPIIGILRSPYLYLDIANLSLFVVSGIMRMILFFHGAHDLDFDAEEFPTPLAYFSIVYEMEQIITAINALLLCVRMLKYLRFFRRLDFLERVLRRAIPDLLNFALIFLFVFVGFVICGYIQFGTNAKEFRALDTSFSTMARFLISDFNYVEIKDNASLMFSLFFTLYIVIGFCYLFNVFLSIMNARVTQENTNKKYDMAPLELFTYWVYRLKRIRCLIKEKRFVRVKTKKLCNLLLDYKKTHNLEYISSKEVRSLFSSILEMDVDFILDRYTKSLFFRLDLQNRISQKKVSNEHLHDRISELEKMIREQNDMMKRLASMLGAKHPSERRTKATTEAWKKREPENLKPGASVELKDISLGDGKGNTASDASNAAKKPSLRIDSSIRTNRRGSNAHDQTTSGGPAGTRAQHHFPYSPVVTPTTPTTTTTNNSSGAGSPITTNIGRVTYPEEHLRQVNEIMMKSMSSLEKYRALEKFAKSHGYALKDTREMVHRLKSGRAFQT